MTIEIAGKKLSGWPSVVDVKLATLEEVNTSRLGNPVENYQLMMAALKIELSLLKIQKVSVHS